MKAPQERKTPKRVPYDERNGLPTLKLDGNDTSLTVTKILDGGRNDSVQFRSREEVELLRDFCEAWLEYDEKQEQE